MRGPGTNASLLLQASAAEISTVPEDKTQLQIKCSWFTMYLERDHHKEYYQVLKL